MKKMFFTTLAIIAFVFMCENLFSQGVAINTDGTTANPSAMLDVKSTNAGILVPRLTLAQRGAISNPATGLLIFQTDNTPGFYYNTGTPAVPSWIKLSIPTDNFDDADADATNELQTISISGHDITLSDGGGTVTVPDNNTTYSAGNQLSLSGTTFNVTEGSGSGLDADLLDGQHYSDIQSWVNTNDDNTTYSAGTGLTLTGTVFTPTFGTTAGTVSEGNHAHTTLTRGTGLTGNNYNGSAATTWAVDYGNATLAGNGTKAQGNFGQFQNHSTYTDFNTNPAYWGWNYVQGNTNAPNTNSSQWYRQVVSLGGDYPARGAGGYSLEMAFPRYNTATAGVWMRTIESGAFGGWTRIDGGANVSGTTNYVAKFTSANVVGNSQIFDNGTNVGVGTAAPSSKLHVDGGNINLAQTAGQTPFTLLGYNNASSLWLISPTTSSKIVIGVAHDWDRQVSLIYTPGTTGAAAGDLTIGQIDKNSAGWTHGITKFYTNGGERMRIDASGNVGIGTASPGSPLHIGTTGWSANQLHFSSGWGTGGYHATIGSGYSGITASGIMLGNPHIPWRTSYGAKMRFASDQSASAYWDLGINGESGGSTDRFDINRNNTNLFTVTNGGNIGIGTTSPLAKLQVRGGKVYINQFGNDPSASYVSADLVLGDDVTTRNGYGGTNGSNLFLQSNDKSTITALDQGNNLGQISYQNLVWTIGENVGWGTQTIKLPNLAGTGNRPVYADANGVLKASSNDNSMWVMSANLASSQDDLGGTILSADNDDDVTYQVALPFSVVIEGITYTYIAVCTNGWVSFETSSGQVTTTTYLNSSLPSSTFSTPTVFAYWDDLMDYGSGEVIRSQTFGTSPNRTVVIDWKMRARNTNVYYTFFQMEIHEGSNLINVKYHSMDPAYCGQSATIGFQLAGGSNAKAFPLTYNGKILDDNVGKSEGWSVCPVK